MAIHRRGSGRVYRRGNIWWMQYYVRGSLVRETTDFTEKADAENLLKQKIGEAAAGRHAGAVRATIGDICALVIEDNRLRRLRDAERRGDEEQQRHCRELLRLTIEGIAAGMRTTG